MKLLIITVLVPVLVCLAVLFRTGRLRPLPTPGAAGRRHPAEVDRLPATEPDAEVLVRLVGGRSLVVEVRQ